MSASIQFQYYKENKFAIILDVLKFFFISLAYLNLNVVSILISFFFYFLDFENSTCHNNNTNIIIIILLAVIFFNCYCLLNYVDIINWSLNVLTRSCLSRLSINSENNFFKKKILIELEQARYVASIKN